MEANNYNLIAIVFTFIFPALITASFGDEIIRTLPVDIGEHDAGDVVTQEFIFENKTASKLKIKSIKASCGCTEVVPESPYIDAGKAIKIKLTVDSRGRAGPFSATVLIVTDPPNPALVKISGRFKALNSDLFLFPREVDIVQVARGTTITQVVSVSRNGNIPVGEIQASSSVEWVDANVDRARSTAKSAFIVVRVTVPASTDVDHLRGDVVVKGKGVEVTRVPVIVGVAPRISATPADLLVTKTNQEFVANVTRSPDFSGAFKGYRTVAGAGLEIRSVVVESKSPSTDRLTIRAVSKEGGLVRGSVLLEYDGLLHPIEVKLIGWNPKKGGR